MPEFQPFVPAGENRPEFTFRALLLGSLLRHHLWRRDGLCGLASRAYRRCIDSRSRCLSISILRAFGRASILENNIVQTTGNAGQSIASGVIFTLPALVFLGFDLEYSRIFMLALIGGWLGVLFMIPLRRQLIVKEHGALPYPEGTACADVLDRRRKGRLAGQPRLPRARPRRRSTPFFRTRTCFSAWPGSPEYQPDFGAQHVLKGASINADATSEYLGVGYIIGSKVAGIIFAGGVFSWLVVMPLIYFFGKDLPHPVYPGKIPIAQMGPSDLWSTYIQADGRGRRRRGRPDHAAQDPADDLERAHRRLQNHAPRRGRDEAKPIRTEDDSVHERCSHRLTAHRGLACLSFLNSSRCPERLSDGRPILPLRCWSSSSDFSS